MILPVSTDKVLFTIEAYRVIASKDTVCKRMYHTCLSGPHPISAGPNSAAKGSQ